MKRLINGATIVNEGLSFTGSVLIDRDRIERVLVDGDSLPQADEIMDATGLVLIPGVIDDQVHFREPGATHKGSIESESAAAVLGGVTSYMDMPNNIPPVITMERLEAKYEIASKSSYANYSFYMGASNDNRDELIKVNGINTCGIKVFMGSSTGNMLVDNPLVLEDIFRDTSVLIATHCEEEELVRANLDQAIRMYGEEIPFDQHPAIRSREACMSSSKKAIDLALKYNSRVHILHVSTKEEVEMIRVAKMRNPRISAETCVHYLFFDDRDYGRLGALMKCNPAIKTREDMEAIRAGVKDGVIEVVATDHAPHTLEEKGERYLKAPSGLPLIQHSLQLMIELCDKGIFTLEEVVDRMAHAPARIFGMAERGYIREGYFADLALIDLKKMDSLSTLYPAYRCKWSPLRGMAFGSSIVNTFVNGEQVVREGKLTGVKSGMRLLFNRER